MEIMSVCDIQPAPESAYLGGMGHHDPPSEISLAENIRKSRGMVDVEAREAQH
jgi:hypothetical protein